MGVGIRQRVSDLLSDMTMDEKIAQLGSLWVYELLTELAYDEARANALLRDGIGQITRVAGASGLQPAEAAGLANRIQKYLLEETRLGIPAVVHEECCAGYMAPGATGFPQAIGMASTWDPGLVEQMGRIIRREMKAAGAHQALSPVLDIARDPRWGRIEETFGEDPYLTASMGTSYIRGFQGNGSTLELVATAKHFVGYGLPEGGMNWAPAHIPPRELREVYLFPFEAAVKEGQLQSIMNAYHELDGIPCGADKGLLEDILREEWGFEGVVVSDYFTLEELIRTHEIAETEKAAAILGLTAGIDVELPTRHCYAEPLKQAVLSGELELEKVDRSVRRILEQKFQLGLFDSPFIDVDKTSSMFRIPEDRAFSTHAAARSMVLLKNEDQLLPLPVDIRKLAVIGPAADSARNLLGDYAYVCHVENTIDMMGEGNAFDTAVPDSIAEDDNLDQVPTILDAVRKTVRPECEILYQHGCGINDDDTSGIPGAVDAAAEAEAAILVLGGRSGLIEACTCGESRDRVDLNLPGVQQQLLDAVCDTGTPVIVVVVNGRPLSISGAEERAGAVLEAWLPGEEGAQAVADVLFGRENPGGKLPVTIPRHVGQVPVYYGHKPSGGRSHWRRDYVDTSSKSLYPFGFGLSYTTFSIANMHLDRTGVPGDGQFVLSVDVQNTGDRSGDEVIQVYARVRAASVTRPVKQLIGFRRVSLQPEELVRVEFTIHADQLGYYDRAMEFVLEPGRIELMVGTSSEDIHHRAEIRITGEKVVLKKKRFFSDARIHPVT